MSIYTSWHVGMKVVCIKDGGWTTWLTTDPMPNGPHPKSREVCVISRIECHGTEVFISVQGYRRNMYAARRFRPVQKRKTNISIFTSMLTKTTAPA